MSESMDDFKKESFEQIDFLFEDEPEKKHAYKEKLAGLWEKVKAAKDSEAVQNALEDIKSFLQSVSDNEHFQNSLAAGKTFVVESAALVGDGLKTLAKQPTVAKVLDKVKEKVNITITINKGGSDETDHNL